MTSLNHTHTRTQYNLSAIDINRAFDGINRHTGQLEICSVERGNCPIAELSLYPPFVFNPCYIFTAVLHPQHQLQPYT